MVLKRIVATLAVATLTTAVANAQSLTTLFAQDNNNSPGGAVYFDLNAVSALTVTELDINVHRTAVDTNGIGGQNVTVDVFTRTGTAIGFQQTTNGWTLVASGVAVSAARDSATLVNISDFTLAAGITGVAITNADYNTAYTEGTGSNQVYSNADLTLTAGSANNEAFSGSVFSPRVWNGTIRYASVAVVPEAGTLALLGVGCSVLGVVVRRKVRFNKA